MLYIVKPKKSVNLNEYLNFVKLDLRIFKIYLILAIAWLISFSFRSISIPTQQNFIRVIIIIFDFSNQLFFFSLTLTLLSFPIYILVFSTIYLTTFKNSKKITSIIKNITICIPIWFVGVLFGFGAAADGTHQNGNIFYELMSLLLVGCSILWPLINYFYQTYTTKKEIESILLTQN